MSFSGMNTIRLVTEYINPGSVTVFTARLGHAVHAHSLQCHSCIDHAWRSIRGFGDVVDGMCPRLLNPYTAIVISLKGVMSELEGDSRHRARSDREEQQLFLRSSKVENSSTFVVLSPCDFYHHVLIWMLNFDSASESLPQELQLLQLLSRGYH